MPPTPVLFTLLGNVIPLVVSVCVVEVEEKYQVLTNALPKVAVAGIVALPYILKPAVLVLFIVPLKPVKFNAPYDLEP